MRATFGLALLAATTLGGCGQSDAQIRDELRAQMLQRCGRDIAPNTSALPGFDSDAYCRCVTDAAMGERSVAELKALFDDRARLTAEGRRAATQCLAQQNDALESAPAPSVEPANDAAPAPAPAADPAPAAERPRERERDPAPAPVAPARPRIEDVRDSPQPRTEPVAPPRATPPPPPRATPPAPRDVPPGFTPPPEPMRAEKSVRG